MTRLPLAAVLAGALAFSGCGAIAMADDPGEAGLSHASVSAAEAGAPVYPGGKPINGGLSKTTLYSKTIGTGVTFSTPDAFEKVYAFYAHAVPPKTVAEKTDGPSNQIGSFEYTKSDGSKISIEIRAYAGHTNYTIVNTYKQ